MAGDNPAVGHKFRWSVNGYPLAPKMINTSALEQAYKTIETSEPHILVTDVPVPVEFTAVFDSDNKLDLAFLDAWLLAKSRWDTTLQSLNNAGTDPVLAWQLERTTVSKSKPTADMDSVETARIDMEYTFHAVVTRLPV